MRIGQGFDAHRFKSGCRLVLGGVEIPHEQGMEAHSDGDVVIHALCDAILGALALGDIGKHFPDSSDSYKGIDSRILLRKVVELMEEREYQINNTDITVIAQAPKLAPYIEPMRSTLADDLKTNIANVSIKATTTEKMGFTGRSEGIAVQAVVLLV
jgi:2-C-methyl-D-erythritol 2,4-cyclodiphosphate synthase